MLGKKSDILVTYPELNMSRYEFENGYLFYFKMWKQLSWSISWKNGERSDRQVLSI